MVSAPTQVPPAAVVPLDTATDVAAVADGGPTSRRGSGQSSAAEADGAGANEDHGTSRRGMYRLLDLGYSEEEVEALRSHFFHEIRRLDRVSQAVAGESADARVYRLEEEWMAVQGPDSEWAMNTGLPYFGSDGGGSQDVGESDEEPAATAARQQLLPGRAARRSRRGAASDVPLHMHARSFVLGVAIGFFVGFISLIWVTDRNGNRPMQLGIAVGVILNLATSAVSGKKEDNATGAAARSTAGSEAQQQPTVGVDSRGRLRGVVLDDVPGQQWAIDGAE